MSYNLKLLKEFSLYSRVLHEVAKLCWGDFVSRFSCGKQDNKDNLMEIERENLVTHRQNTLDKVSEITSVLPKIIGNELITAVIRLQRGYIEALVCAGMYIFGNKYVTPSPLTTGPYAAKNFIDPSGYFNELFWAQRLISDESGSLYGRFELACFYCLEDAIRNLWRSVKDGGCHPYEGSFNDLWIKFSYLVGLWVYQLENKFQALMVENETFAPGFYVCGFKYAKTRGYEYAVRFFWKGCSDTEKARWIEEMDEMDYHDLLNMAVLNYAGCVNFIYSLLPLEQKINCVNLIQNDVFSVWICLLLSPFYESVLNDILTISFPISTRPLTITLEALSYKMTELPIPAYREIFEVLWNFLPLNKRIEFFQRHITMIISNLLEIVATGLLITVIQPLSPALKEQMLLYDWQFAGITVLDFISSARDYDSLHRYLFSFIMDRDPVTQKLIVRDGASDLLDRFINGERFIDFINGEIPKYERKGVNEVMDNLRGSLQVLNSLLDQVEDGQSFDLSVSENESIDGNDKDRKLKRSSLDPTEEINLKKLKLENNFTTKIHRRSLTT